ncbi:MAG: SDR family NAD(P)-dependent oxidoreductase, partial [Pseudomonadota bacterium]
MKDLTGKIAIVTGASAPRGIGRAIALRLANDGASVVLTDIAGTVDIDGNPHDKTRLLEETRKEINSAGGESIWLEVDVTQSTDIEACVRKTIDTWGSIDIL